MILMSKLATPGSLLLGLALVGYSLARAALVSYNNDEALTFLYHVRASVADIVSYRVNILPSNNHLLNSLLMKASSVVLGESEVALRLPNVLAHVLYLAMSLLIVRRYVPSFLALAAFLVLNLNPYALEFFSLSRGYGLALSFMMVSLYFCLRHVESERRAPLHVFLSSLFAALAVTASIPFANVYAGLAIVLGVTVLLRRRLLSPELNGLPRRLMLALRDGAPLVLNTALMAAIMVPAVLRLRRADHFITGGTLGFWPDTVMSLVDGSLYGREYKEVVSPLLAGLVVVVFAFNVLLFLYHGLWRREHHQRLSLTLVLVPLTVLVAVSSILHHQMFGVNYLKGRIGVMFIPLFSLLLVNAAVYLVSVGRASMLRKLGVALLLLAAVGVSLHALMTFNVTHSMVLRGNASTKQAMDALVAHYATTFVRTPGQEEVKLGISGIYKPVVTYYALSRDLDWLEVVEFNTLKEDVDYYYYDREDGRVLDKKNLIRLAVYPSTGATLATKVPD